MEGKKLLNGSGGSTKGAGIIGAWNALYDEGYRPDIISGISISAYLAVVFALGKREQASEVMTNIDQNQIWEIPPVKDNGKLTISALWRAARGKSFGDQSKSIELLRSLVSKEEFQHYRNSNLPTVVTMSVDFATGERIFTNMKEVYYDEFLKYTLASGSIPVYAMPVKHRGMILYDGGVLDHCIGHHIMMRQNISESISVYSREENYQEALDTDAFISGSQEWCPKNYNIDALERSLDIMNYETSFNDAKEEKSIAEDQKKPNLQIFLPKILTSLYDTDSDRLKKLYDISNILARDKYKSWKK